jgi:late competence protein required for DNA uptake (superfamily II DNA/RNA helicase)
MRKKLLLKSEATSALPVNKDTANVNDNKKIEIENEIECPRCHDIMTLSSEFNRLCYFCDECSFSLQIQ